jgi:dTDP-4-dehydrorhamnose 3,5-epimerase
MDITATTIAGLYELRLAPREDDRGYFMRTYDCATFAKHGLQTQWLQDNQSKSVCEGTVRGLHFQRPPHAETKFVRVLSGAVFDVAVDLRRDSPTYGRHYATELSETNHRCLYIPQGCAHGFCTLLPNSIVAYKVDHVYTPQAEGGLLWNDPCLAIAWPVVGEPRVMSDKDRAWPRLERLEPISLDCGRSNRCTKP